MKDYDKGRRNCDKGRNDVHYDWRQRSSRTLARISAAFSQGSARRGVHEAVIDDAASEKSDPVLPNVVVRERRNESATEGWQ